jgi:hypothetical protein
VSSHLDVDQYLADLEQAIAKYIEHHDKNPKPQSSAQAAPPIALALCTLPKFT